MTELKRKVLEKLPAARRYLRAARWGLDALLSQKPMGAGYLFHAIGLLSTLRACQSVLYKSDRKLSPRHDEVITAWWQWQSTKDFKQFPVLDFITKRNTILKDASFPSYATRSVGSWEGAGIDYETAHYLDGERRDLELDVRAAMDWFERQLAEIEAKLPTRTKMMNPTKTDAFAGMDLRTMNLSLKRRSLQNRRFIAATVLCTLAGLCASFRQPTSAKAEHSLPPVIRLDIDSNDNAVVPACRTITSYLNHAANPDARTSWQTWASGNECEALNDRVAQKDELELYHIYHVLERKDGFVCVRLVGDDEPCYWTAVANLHHIDKQRLSDAQFKKVEELNEQVSELSDLASQYLNAAQRTYDRTDQRRLEKLADRAQDEADRLYDQLLAIKPSQDRP